MYIPLSYDEPLDDCSDELQILPVLTWIDYSGNEIISKNEIDMEIEIGNVLINIEQPISFFGPIIGFILFIIVRCMNDEDDDTGF